MSLPAASSPYHFSPERTVGALPRYDVFGVKRLESDGLKTQTHVQSKMGPINTAEVAAPKKTAPAEDQVDFWDLVDFINPLQHLPIIGDVYRAVTGDTIRPAARIVGGTIYGGGIGLLSASISLALQEEFGQSPGARLAQAVIGDEGQSKV